MRRILFTVGLVAVALSANPAIAEITQDCILEGTVKDAQTGTDQKKVYVAFHSATNPEKQQSCHLKRRTKLHFKQPADSEIGSAPVGSKVRYRYREHDHESNEMELISVSS